MAKKSQSVATGIACRTVYPLMNRQHKTRLTRRAMLCGLLLAPTMGLAHSGHGAARISAEATVIRRKGNTVKLVLRILNTGSRPIKLFKVTAEGAAPVTLGTPLEIAGFGEGNLMLSLEFHTAIPGIFTAHLDFGDHGQGPVTVMP